MIRALNAPQRRATWILSAAVVAASLVVAIAFWMHSGPTPPQIARVTAPPVPVEVVTPEPPPAIANPVLEHPVKTPAKKEVADAVTTAPIPPAPEAPRAQQFAPQQQNAIGGPRQMASQARVAGASALVEQKPGFGFNYSLDTEGHLVIVPAADGYLFVKSNDGTVLHARKQIAAAITTDIALPGVIRSVTVTFSADSDPVNTAPSPRAASSGTVEGASPLAIELRVPRK
jgi:hypothetical protein